MCYWLFQNYSHDTAHVQQRSIFNAYQHESQNSPPSNEDKIKVNLLIPIKLLFMAVVQKTTLKEIL